MDLDVQHVARTLDEAERRRAPIVPLSESYPDLTTEQAYAIQSAWLALKQPAKLLGHKIGLTSFAMQKLLGIDQPDYGFLLDRMLIYGGQTLRRDDFIAPRIEPEIAFWLGQDLRGPGLSGADVLAATESVCASLELVDSRVSDWRIKLVDTIADNASSARVIVGERRIDPRDLDLAAESVNLFVGEREARKGDGRAVLGHPATAVAWLANKLAEFGVGLRAGQLVLPGAMCAAVDVQAGESYRADFARLGEIVVHFR